MSKKQRAPIEQLREASKLAREMLVKKGILSEKSIIDEIIKKEGTPLLPGIPPYLPHRWTIKTAQRIMFDLLIMWKAETQGKHKDQEDITEFFKFVIKEMRKQDAHFQQEINKMSTVLTAVSNIPVLKEVFSPLRKKENMKAIQHFFVDSFAIAIMLKRNHTTTDYANWFLDWTEDMHALWLKPETNKI